MTYTNQSIFDQAVQGVLDQGQPSFDPIYKECLYRGPNGSRCAAGHLLPDSEYNPNFEHNGASDINWFNDKFSIEQMDLITDLQIAHDSASGDYTDDDPNKWFISQVDGFRRVALKYGLDQNLLKNF